VQESVIIEKEFAITRERDKEGEYEPRFGQM
jgi:hypothetical protein